MTSSNSNSMVTKVMNYLSFMLNLIEAQDWNRLENAALSNPKVFKIMSKSISDIEEFNGMTLLHACVRCNPPIKLLDEMIKLYPQALKEEDCLGRTPLHVAAGSGASPKVIKLLTANYPQACDIQDEDGRTPLHFACDTACELFEDDDCSPRGPTSLDTVRVLLSGSLSAVTLEDVDEMNAIEYAILSDASKEVVVLLQRATQRVMKQAKKSNNHSRTSSPTSVRERISVH